MKRGMRGGWILAETLIAALIGGGAIGAAVLSVRSADLMTRQALQRADAVALAERLLETARADPAAPTEGETDNRRFAWRVDRMRPTAESPWRPVATQLRVSVTPESGKTVVLTTHTLEGRAP